MTRKQKRLRKALKPFMSERMQSYLEDWPDDTMVGLEVMGRNGYLVTTDLKSLRKLWAAYYKIHNRD